ncbi:DMT family transporter [Lyticum sinuosum]|uniref:S-adenosylmethionine uptake transporter n=1 Tax=Lyticum sinuosum TaxID=1332059 RepID=A0AAE5AHG2_9RICK|nr:DMT family transporter [Lyticum sinuosum]MDZ5761535.1 EamA family transporter [Lyticum sinuosum]
MKNIRINGALYGIVFMLIHTLCLSLIDVSAKILRKSELSSGFVVFCYKFSLLLIILPFIIYKRNQYLKSDRIFVHIIRSISGTLGALFFYHGLKFLPMADAAAIENIQYLIIFCLGFVIFKEKISKTKIVGIIVGFIGALIVVRPDWFFSSTSKIVQANADKTYIYIIIAICCWAFNSIIIKMLGNTEHNMTQMFYILLFASIISFPTAIFEWNNINIVGINLPLNPSLIDFKKFNIGTENILLIFCMALIYFIHNSAYFLSLRSELSIVVPFRYTKLIFSGIFGYIAFKEKVEIESLIGYGTIFLSSLILARYQMKKRKSKHELLK